MAARSSRDIETGGIAAVVGTPQAAHLTYLALSCLQHRGNEVVGLASHDKFLRVSRWAGWVQDIDAEDLRVLEGYAAIGRVGCLPLEQANLQPIVGENQDKSVAIAKDGVFTRALEIRAELLASGQITGSDTDSSILVGLLLSAWNLAPLPLLVRLYLRLLGGSYSVVVLTKDMVVAARDPQGGRPLVIGSIPQNNRDATLIASETAPFNVLDIRHFSEVEPGEVVTISMNGTQRDPFSFCAFEHIKFAREDSVVFGRPVNVTREESGRQLAKMAPAVADCVVASDAGSISAAIGYAEASGLPYTDGIFLNRGILGSSVGFPADSNSRIHTRLTKNPILSVIRDRRVVLVFDSLVLTDSIHSLVRLVRDAGAVEIHVRCASPPMLSSCPFGIETPDEDELQKNLNSEALCSEIGADSLHCLSEVGLTIAMGELSQKTCYRCFRPAGNQDLLPTPGLLRAHRSLWDPPIRGIMSVFISYGAPDEAFADRLEEALQSRGAQTFYFKKHARAGQKIHRLIHEGVNSYERMVLVCSSQSLNRPGVQAEIEAVLEREAREGGSTVLIPIRRDDYVLSDWLPKRPDIAQAIRDRVVADFRDLAQFDLAVTRLLEALRRS